MQTTGDETRLRDSVSRSLVSSLQSVKWQHPLCEFLQRRERGGEAFDADVGKGDGHFFIGVCDLAAHNPAFAEYAVPYPVAIAVFLFLRRRFARWA